MSLETATFIADLVVTNPESTDGKKQGDDHLRLIKSVLQNTILRGTKAWALPDVTVLTDDYSIVEADNNILFAVNTTSEEIDLDLPSLSADDDGWQCFVLKTNTGANRILIDPPSGTINGFSAVRRSVEHLLTHIYWTGSVFVASRPLGVPIGSVIPFYGSTLPNGFLWTDGTSFSSADYPELNSVLGGTTLPDLRARVMFGLDNNSSVSRNAPSASTAIDDDNIGNTAGAAIVVGFIITAE